MYLNGVDHMTVSQTRLATAAPADVNNDASSEVPIVGLSRVRDGPVLLRAYPEGGTARCARCYERDTVPRRRDSIEARSC